MHNCEETDSLDRCIRQKFGLEHKQAQLYSPLVLAYIGDGIYELVIRTIVVGQGNRQGNKLHRQAAMQRHRRSQK